MPWSDTGATVDLELGSGRTDCKHKTKIEEYRDGYPRFSALIAASGDFFIFRSFLRLRARLLLSKQDELSFLEQQLDQIDQNETSPIFLGKSRSDRNRNRSSTLHAIDTKLIDYDSLLERTYRIMNFNSALPRDVLSLQNWVEGTGCLSRDETKYLKHERELFSLVPPGDNAMKQLEDWVEDQLVRHYKNFRAVDQHHLSLNPNVYVYSGPLVKRIARAIMLILITVLLLMPVVVCIIVNSMWARICVIITSTVIFLTILSRLTKSRMIELILAGATFAAVLTVFVSGVNGGPN